jgi:hypothetical protein
MSPTIVQNPSQLSLLSASQPDRLTLHPCAKRVAASAAESSFQITCDLKIILLLEGVRSLGDVLALGKLFMKMRHALHPYFRFSCASTCAAHLHRNARLQAWL